MNYYRRSLPHLGQKTPAEVLQPLYRAATQKVPNKKFTQIWEEEGLEEHFENAKKLLVLATNLSHPDPNAPIALVTDASSIAIGGSLEQLVKGRWQPLGFWSRHLKPNEAKWSTFQRELYAVQQGLRHFLPEIKGRHCVVYSDHLPLISAFKNPASMPYDHIAQNHLNEIQQWTYDIRHVSGRLNTVADALSRPAGVPLGSAYTLPPPDNDAGDWDGPPTGHNVSAAAEKGQSLLFTVDPKDLALDQETCPDVARHRAGQHVTGLNVSKVEFAPGVWLWADVSDGKKSRPIVPKKHREPLIKLFHCLSHPGQRETLKKVSAH